LAAAFLARYPRSRFRIDALGWLARTDYVAGRYVAALREYKRLFAAAAPGFRPSVEILHDRSESRHSERLNASGPMFRIYDSIAGCQMAMGKSDAAFATYLEAYEHCDKALAAWYLQDWNVRVGRRQAARLAAMLVNRPALLQPYLDFRIHMTTPRNGDYSGLVALGERCLRSHPRTRLTGLILARLAEIAYVGKRYASARRLASRGMRIGGEGADLALYVFGATSNRMRRYREAADAFRNLIKDYPRSRLVGGARECLALACEKTGGLAESLQQYVTLKYHWDVAYLLDVRMSTADIEAFLATHPAAGTRKVALYALAMRYLRRDHFGRAEEMLRKLSRLDRLKLSWLAKPPSERYLGWDEGSELYDPLRTAHDLARLRQAYKTALRPGSKARALFALAGYYHKHRNLLLYNPSLWKGERALCYEMFWDKSVATQADAKAWRAHSYEHECMARSRALCLEIVHRYPRSSVAPRAAYTAGVDCFRLSTLNSWWRDEDARVSLSKQAVRLMELVVRRYPKSSVAGAAAKYAVVFSDESRRRSQSSVFSQDQ
jgi:tetratricopeptide (TPR) repeat protein